MAPAAVEVHTATVPDVATLKLQASHNGPYKELAANKYDAEAEAGLKGHKPAKVSQKLVFPCAGLCSRHSRPQTPLLISRLNGHPTRQYPHYLPTWDRNEKYPPLEPFEHYEHGKDADTSYPNLLPEGVTVTHLTPTIGTEVRGTQLSALSPAGKDELARFVAERKVVAFRDQDFADLPIEKALDFGSYFGRYEVPPPSSRSLPYFPSAV